MGDDSKIQWTDATWNPTRGCSLVSAGCTHCYAMSVAARFAGPGLPYEGLARRSSKGLPQWTGELRLVTEKLDLPLRWKRPRRIFVNSMSDLFHEKLTNEQIAAVFGVMAAAPRHTFQVLTKRSARMHAWFEWAAKQTRYAGVESDPAEVMRAIACDRHGVSGDRLFRIGDIEWPLPNVWCGVSVEDQASANERIPHLLRVPAAVRFLSCEPLLSPVKLDLLRNEAGVVADCECGHGHGFTRCPNTGGIASSCHHKCGCPGFRRRPTLQWRGIDWLIVGAESGPYARPFDLTWARSLLAQCKAAGTAAFVKQLGAKPVHGGDDVGISITDKKGGDIDEFPIDLRVREFPTPRATP